MSQQPSAAERLDHALDGLLDGAPPRVAAATAGLATDGHPLVTLAEHLRAALVTPPVAPRFEARLGTRLATAGPTSSSRDAVGWALRHPGRLIVTGAVGSAVGVGVTAYAVWRSSRRATATHRLLHR
ncbi:MAG: hypothetical protein M3153_06315 [Chloroflexota bacterium]|nr:hypothetical protein [Chloroflexota bacterium]